MGQMGISQFHPIIDEKMSNFGGVADGDLPMRNIGYAAPPDPTLPEVCMISMLYNDKECGVRGARVGERTHLF